MRSHIRCCNKNKHTALVFLYEAGKLQYDSHRAFVLKEVKKSPLLFGFPESAYASVISKFDNMKHSYKYILYFNLGKWK